MAKNISAKERMEQFSKEASGSKKAEEGPEQFVMLNTRVPKRLLKALKLLAVQEEMTIQAFVNEALEASLKERKAL